MMKLMLALILTAMAVFAGAAKADVERAVLAAEKSWADAVIKGEQANLDKLLGEDLSYTHSSAKTETKEDVLKSVAAGSGRAKSIEFTDTKVRQYGNVVVVTHKAAFTNPSGAVANLYVTHVWAKQGGGWQLVSRQATRLP